MSFFDEVYEVVAKVPKGKVTTYGDVARMTGHPRASRQVGWALHVNPRPGNEIPCHRVVFKSGSVCTGFAFGGPEVQRALLEAEGITFDEDGMIDMSIYRWEGE